MAGGNDNQQSGASEIWSPYSDPSVCLQTPYNPAMNIGDEPMEVENYDDVFNVLSDIDLQYSAPPPEPLTSTNIPRLMERGEPSGAKYRNSDNLISHSTTPNEVINSKEEREREQKRRQDIRQFQPKRMRSSEAHNLLERRRRSRIQERLKALQQLIPNSNKTDKASMLDEAIEYIKSLQHQLELMKFMGVPHVMSQFPAAAGHHRMQVPCFPPLVPMRPEMMGMCYGMGAYASPCNSAGFHAFPNFGIHPPLPLSTPPVGESRVLLPVVPRRQYLTFPLHQSFPSNLTSTTTTTTTSAQVIPGTAADHNIYQTPATNHAATQAVRSLGNAYAGALRQLNEDNEARKTDQP